MYTATARPLSVRRFERGAFDFALIFTSLILVALVSLAAFWHVWHLNRIYSGVSIAGVAVGGLTRGEAVVKLQNEAEALPLPPILLDDGSRQWPLDNNLLSAKADWLSIVNQAYLIGRSGRIGDHLVEQFTTALGGKSLNPRLQLDPGQMRNALNRIAEDARRPAQAGIESSGVVIPAQPGVELDVDQTLQLVVNTLASTDSVDPISVPMKLIGIQPQAEAQANTATSPTALLDLPSTGILLKNDPLGLSFAIDPATTRKLVAVHEPFTVDEFSLRKMIDGWARQIDIAARDARLSFNPNSGAVNVVRPSQPGRKLDVEATYQAVAAALAAKSPTAELKIDEVPPAVDMNNIAYMGIQELVVSASTYFKGSSAGRIHNIKVGAAKFEGVVVPPGGIFSFNRIVEDVSLANGFGDALVIFGDATVNGVGGGICQVSTTIFRAAFQGGFPIVERYNHGYVVGWYGEPGADATIFTPGVDFRFRNDTGAYLLLDPYVDGENGVITFNFYGTNPGRQVTVSQPIIEDVKLPPPPKYTFDATLPEGTIKQVEWENKGMTVKIVRTISDANGTRSGEIVSNYTPWGAAYKYGANANVPGSSAPAPAALPTPTEIPAEPAAETTEG